MSKNANCVALACWLLAAPAFGNEDNDRQPYDMPAVAAEDRSDPCSESARNLLRELARTDGDTNPQVQSEEDCRRQSFWDRPEARGGG
jgi:hypothetical protein